MLFTMLRSVYSTQPLPGPTNAKYTTTFCIRMILLSLLNYGGWAIGLKKYIYYIPQKHNHNLVIYQVLANALQMVWKLTKYLTTATHTETHQNRSTVPFAQQNSIALLHVNQRSIAH